MAIDQVSQSTPFWGQWPGLDLGALLAVTATGQNSFGNRLNEDNRNGRVFGGQLLGQALQAAQSVAGAGRAPSSLRVLFMQGALVEQAITYTVQSLQEGKRFSSYRVSASQGPRSLIEAHITFALPLAGVAHAAPWPASCPAPEQVLPMAQLAACAGPAYEKIDWTVFEKPCLELRIVDPDRHLTGTSSAPQMMYWLRLRTPLDDAAASHAAALAYLSDYWINSAAITHHIAARDAHAAAYIASLNHSIWFHHSCRADDWLLFVCDSPATQQGRALSHARIYDRQGVLVASVAQECLFVLRE